MLFFAAAAFVLAFTLPSNKASGQPPENASAQSLAQTQNGEPALPPSVGVEPTIPSGDSAGWALTLVNPWNALPEGYEISLKQLSNGHAVDERCYPDLQAMMDACRQEGLSPLICSSYRSQEKQEALFQNKVDRLVAQGYSREAVSYTPLTLPTTPYV